MRGALGAVALGVAVVLSVAVVRPVDGQAGVPRVLLLDGARLAEMRQQAAAGEDGSRSSLEALRRDADRALAMAPVSVMDKGVAPPSGDKHDYMSQAPYWWPDPARPNGLPYIRRDGERNPEINRISDHDNLGHLASAVNTLGIAYFVLGGDQYARHAAELVRVWFLNPATRMNPHLRFGQGIPGITEGRGIGIIEMRGLPDLIDGVLLIQGSDAWSTADEDGLQSWMRSFLTWLLESPHGRDEAKNGNNHETWYDVQAASLALYTGQPDAARRVLEGSERRIAAQIQPDGRMLRELERTRAFDYSLFNLEAFFHLADLGSRVGVDLWHYRTADGRSLRQALDFLVPFAAGEKKWTYDQITEWRPAAISPLLRKAAVAWSEPRYRELAAAIGGASPRPGEP